jgi:hypothetical protein
MAGLVPAIHDLADPPSEFHLCSQQWIMVMKRIGRLADDP